MFTDKASGKDTKRPQLQAALGLSSGRRQPSGVFDGQAGPQSGRSDANCLGADQQGGPGRIRQGARYVHGGGLSDVAIAALCHGGIR